MSEQEFLTVEDHFNALVDTLDDDSREAYDRLRAVRIETAFKGRHFIVYKVRGKDPVELDRITFEDYECNDEDGATAMVRSMETGEELVVGYTPVKLFTYPIFLFLPLHSRIRWATWPGNVGKGSLAFPVGIRTQSRRGMRENNVIHCETGVLYGQEFNFAIDA